MDVLRCDFMVGMFVLFGVVVYIKYFVLILLFW